MTMTVTTLGMMTMMLRLMTKKGHKTQQSCENPGKAVTAKLDIAHEEMVQGHAGDVGGVVSCSLPGPALPGLRPAG